MEHAHLSHAHIVLQMSLTHRSKLEPKKLCPNPTSMCCLLAMCGVQAFTIVNFGEGFKLLCQVPCESICVGVGSLKAQT